MKTSAEMFAIYKYTSNPVMFVRSEKYTAGQFVQVKDIEGQQDSFLETSISNLFHV